MTIANVKGNNVIMFFSELKGKVSQKMPEKYVTPVSTYLQTRHLVRMASAAALTPLSSILLTTSTKKEGGIPQKMKVGTYCM